MRRLVPLLLLVPMVVSGCGTEDPSAAPGAASTSSVTPSESPTTTPSSSEPPTSTPTPTPQTDLHGPLAAFPLAQGYDATNGDDGSPVVVTTKPATRAFPECGRQVWDPQAGSTDVIGVEYHGEAEWYLGRTLVLYPTAAAATAAVDAAREAIAACPQDPQDDTGYTAHTLVDHEVGDQSFGWVDRYWSPDVEHFDTGLTVYLVVRVGRAVLLSYQYDEGNGSEQTRRTAIAEAKQADQPVVDAMTALADAPAAVTFTPHGAGPFRLGMTAEQVRLAAPSAELRVRPASCTALTWQGPAGEHVFGALDPEAGLVYLSSPEGTTAEAVGARDTVADLRAAYPQLQHADNGLWHVDLGATSYAFDVGTTGQVDDVLVIGDDQHCAS